MGSPTFGANRGDESSAVSTWAFYGRVHGPVWQRRAMRGGVDCLALARWLCLSGVWLRRDEFVSTRGTAVLAVLGVPASMQRHEWHHLRVHQAWLGPMVLGHAPADPIQEQRLGTRTHAPSG